MQKIRLTETRRDFQVPIIKRAYDNIHDFNWDFEQDSSEQPLYICFSLKNGHAFLITGKYELHGHLFFKKIKKKYFSKYLTYRPLLLLRFPNTSTVKIRNLQSLVEKKVGTHEKSCIHLIANILSEGADINMCEKHMDMKYLHQFLDSFFKLGFKDSLGNKVKFETYILQDMNLSQVYDQISLLEKRFYYFGYFTLFIYTICMFIINLRFNIKSFVTSSTVSKRPHS